MFVHRRLIIIPFTIISLLLGSWWLVKTYWQPYQPAFWVTGYLPAYRHNGRDIPFLTADDYQTLTHISHASVIPQADGSLDRNSNNLTAESQQAALIQAQRYQLPLLLSVHGSYETFQVALQDPVRPRLLANLLQLLDSGYDGIDLDMEPITRNDQQLNQLFMQFVRELHQALRQRHNTKLHRTPLLTVAISLRDRLTIAQLVDYFDQINLMAYDMAQPYAGWISWYDSALTNGGLLFPGYSHPVPSVDLWIERLLASGIPAHKLGLGISFDVACWYGGLGTSTGGISMPRQSWSALPRYRKLSYAELYASGFFPTQTHWDPIAQMAWFGEDQLQDEWDFFCNFNDAQALQAKVAYAKQRGLGGIMLWELGLDHVETQTGNARRPLRYAIQRALMQSP